VSRVTALNLAGFRPPSPKRARNAGTGAIWFFLRSPKGEIDTESVPVVAVKLSTWLW
jgi:hypothetical protein